MCVCPGIFDPKPPPVNSETNVMSSGLMSSAWAIPCFVRMALCVDTNTCGRPFSQ